MRMTGGIDMSTSITGIVGFVILMVAAFVLYPLLISYSDGLGLRFKESCAIGDSHFKKVFAPAATSVNPTTAKSVYDASADKLYGPGIEVTNTNPGCGFSAATGSFTDAGTVSTTMYTERGNSITVAGTLAAAASDFTISGSPDHQWVKPSDIYTGFGNIGGLIVSFLPIVITLGFLSSGLTTVISAMQKADVGKQVGGMLGKLIVTIVLLVMLPVVFDQLATSSTPITSDAYTNTDRFGTLIDLILESIPILMLLSLLGWQFFNIFTGYKAVQSSGLVGRARGMFGGA